MFQPVLHTIKRLTRLIIFHLQQYRNWFAWKWLPAVWGPVLGMSKLAVDYPDVSALWFLLTYLYIGLAGAWTLGCWLASDLLHSFNPDKWKPRLKKRATPRAWQKFKYLKFGGVVAILFASIVVGSIVRWIQAKDEIRKEQEIIAKQEAALQEELKQLKGRLLPANEPMPSHSCGQIGPNELAVFIGSNTFITHKFPQTILEISGKRILVVDKMTDGSISVSLDIRSRDGRIIARLHDGEFVINPQNYLDGIPRKDRSSLTVTDQNGMQVLDMRYINSQAIKINTVLKYPGMEPLRFDEGGTRWGGFTMGGACLRNIGGGFIAIDQ